MLRGHDRVGTSGRAPIEEEICAIGLGICAMADQRYHRHSKSLADALRSAAAFSLENAYSMGSASAE